MDTTRRKPYPTDASNEEWAFLAPYLTTMREDDPSRHHSPSELLDRLRFIVRTRSTWRSMHNKLLPWPPVYR